MKFLESPAAFLAAMALAIFTFGVGLTSPIWLMVMGNGPLEAVHAGTPIVVAAIIGLMITVFLGVLATRLKKPSSGNATPTFALSAEDSERRHRIVHIVVILMFVIPFVTIVVGYLLKTTIDFTIT